MKTDFEPSPTALGVLGVMVEHDDIMREILQETLDSQEAGQILESGRTLCDSTNQIKGPINRFPKAVDLQQCPISGTGGIWHTHVTRDELLNPENSLPDIAAVVLGHVDVVSVVGTETVEYVLAAEDRDAMAAEFSDALGERIESQDELVDAIVSGRIDPFTSRRRVQDRFSELIVTEETGYDDLTEVVKSRYSSEDQAVAAYEKVELGMTQAYIEPQQDTGDCYDDSELDYASAMATPRGCNEYTSMMADSSAETVGNIIPASIYQTAVGAAVGTVVGNLVDSYFFS